MDKCRTIIAVLSVVLLGVVMAWLLTTADNDTDYVSTCTKERIVRHIEMYGNLDDYFCDEITE